MQRSHYRLCTSTMFIVKWLSVIAFHFLINFYYRIDNFNLHVFLHVEEIDFPLAI